MFKEYNELKEQEQKALFIDSVMPRFYLMGIEFNNIWKTPDFYVEENDDVLITANDDIDEATSFKYDDALKTKQYLQENYNDYTWYLVALNGA